VVTFNLYFVGDQYFQFEYTDGLMETETKNQAFHFSNR